MRPLIERELQCTISEYFLDFDPIPIGSGCVAQVFKNDNTIGIQSSNENGRICGSENTQTTCFT